MPQQKNNSKQTKNSAERNGDKPQNAYFLSLEVENIRCFGEKQKIDFSHGNNNPRQWTIILGDNGTGKTTILQNIVAMSPVESDSQFKEVGLLTISKIGLFPFSQQTKLKRSRVSSFFSTQDTLTEIGNGDSILISEIAKKRSNTVRSLEKKGFYINIFAYGASRKVGNTSISEQDQESSYISLFDDSALLVNPEEWLLQADYASKRDSDFRVKRKKELGFVKNLLLKVLPDIDKIRFSETKSGRTPKPVVEFHTPYGWVESKDLSLGYRTSMAWMVDFASRMFDRYPESENPLAEPAVVLIDEIDLHLHPKWQRELIDYLTNLFPNTQFIVTTHSPLIVQAAAARDANIVVCRREGDHVVIDQSVEAVRNWRTDQILTSDLFDLPIDRAKDIEPLMEERQKILSKAKLTKKDGKRLEELETEIGSVPVMENPKYDEAMDIILRAAEKLGKENGASNDSHKKASKNPANSKR